MLKTSLLVLFSLVIAIGGGGASAWYALQEQRGVGAVAIGGWTTSPDIGTPDSDPYSRARIARAGILALGRAEGLAFVARRDSGGRLLRRECRYVFEGPLPPARFWTLYAADEELYALGAGSTQRAALHSQETLRIGDNSVRLAIGPRPSPGVWLPTFGTGQLTLVLTLYDTQVGSGTGVVDIQLPQLLSAGCDA